MKNNTISPILKTLISEKSDLCVSMIIPLHEIPSFKKMDSIVVDHAIAKLKALMEPSYPPAIVSEFISKISYLKDDVRRVNGVKGIGIFMSDKTFHTETFPFEVQERIHAGTSFEVRDLLYKELQMKEYLLLSLTGYEVKLFRGSANHLSEVTDNNFPASLVEETYAAPAIQNQAEDPAQQVKRRKSEITESSKSFYNTLDKKLLEYIQPEQVLLLAGVEKEIAAFEGGTAHKEKIKGRIHGSYDHYNIQELENKAWETIQQITQASEKEMVASLNELFGRQLVAMGIRDVWRSAMTGKGNILVVEKDLMTPGFVGEDQYQLWLSPPKEKHTIITDAVDDIIEIVLEKNGKVMFVEKGALAEFAGIAMINRY
jgi:hypothetical protein